MGDVLPGVGAGQVLGQGGPGFDEVHVGLDDAYHGLHAPGRGGGVMGVARVEGLVKDHRRWWF